MARKDRLKAFKSSTIDSAAQQVENGRLRKINVDLRLELGKMCKENLRLEKEIQSLHDEAARMRQTIGRLRGEGKTEA